MNQNNKKERIKKKILQFFFAAIIICAAASLLGDLAAWILSAMGGMSFTLNRATSVGIIGGADGPTSVLIMSAPVSYWPIALKAVILLSGTLGLYFLKRK